MRHRVRAACSLFVHRAGRSSRVVFRVRSSEASSVLWQPYIILTQPPAGLDVPIAACATSMAMIQRTFNPSETVDFVIVGSGASGGVIARELSTAGFTVVVMEQGPRLGPGDFEHDELKYNYLSGITNDPKISPQTFRVDASQKAEQPHWGNSLVYARIVGGSSAHYTANFWPFHENDFKERSLLGAIPGTTFADWPITYQDLEPYYTKVDWE